MRKFSFRFIAVSALAALFLCAGGFVAWQYLHDRIEERRLIALGDAVVRLEETRASMDEVRELLGEPDHQMDRGSQVSWFYSVGKFRGFPQSSVVVDIDLKTSRVVSVQFVNTH